MTNKKQKKLIGLACMGLALVVAIFGIVYLVNATKPQEGAKTITVHVTHKDSTGKDFVINTTDKFLADALLQEKIVSGTNGEYGLFITTVDGEKADDKKEEWWCITKGGATVNTSVSQTPIADGEKYEITHTTGW